MSNQPPAASPLLPLDRRGALLGGALGALACALPASAQTLSASAFSHGVASGEPGADRVLLWTRYVAAADVALRYEVSDSLDFARIVAGGEVVASPARDGCAKVFATGLEPDRWYYFRFVAPDGAMSESGRTRTLPVDAAARWRMAVFSCSNLGFGWFDAYAHAAEANDFDCVLHLGDYLYEYAQGTYPSKTQAIAERVPAPVNEIVALADYRARYAAYRRDPDLRRLHQVYPWITVYDDHESANDSWQGGAENHDPATEGEWSARTKAALQARSEWLPVSDEPWAAYQVGNLATLLRLETRLTARAKPISLAALTKGMEPDAAQAALVAFRNDGWRDPARELLGPAQQAWLAQTLAASRRRGTRWQVLVQQVIMGNVVSPADFLDNLPATVPDYVRRRVASGSAAARAGLPFSMDAWDGYPAARERVLRAALEAGADLITLTGDSHNAWAFDLDLGGERVGVEFAGQSVTSPGFEGYFPGPMTEGLTRALVGRNPQLKWAELSKRGYIALTLTPERATSDFRFAADVRRRGAGMAGNRTLTVLAGQRRLAEA